MLKGRVNKSEFIKVLGKTQAEALRQYGVYHAHVEHLIALAKGGVTGLSPTEQRERLSALLTEWGAEASTADANNFANLITEYCPPNSVTYGQHTAVFQKYLLDNPEVRHDSARSLAQKAFAKAFPCN